MHSTHYRYADIDGQQLFYREAGAADAPALVLLHGFPASSFMFRNLIPLLSDRYHVIAPDHLGFGLSSAPSADEFDCSFSVLGGLTAGLLVHLGVTRYALYVHDYGAPARWRQALAKRGAISAIITQNGNGYEAGFTRDVFEPGLIEVHIDDARLRLEPGQGVIPHGIDRDLTTDAAISGKHP